MPEKRREVKDKQGAPLKAAAAGDGGGLAPSAAAHAAKHAGVGGIQLPGLAGRIAEGAERRTGRQP